MAVDYTKLLNGNALKAIKSYVDGTFLKNYKTDTSRPNGTTFTFSTGTNPVQMRSGATSGADIGIFYLSDDNSFIVNSGDSGFNFAVFDCDKGADFSSADNAAFAILQSWAGIKMKGDLTVAGSITSGGTAVSLNGHTHTKSQITDFPTSMPANGGTSDYTNYLNITSTRLENGSNKLQFMQYSGATDNPSNDWYSHIIMHHANNAGYYTEIATHFHGDNVYFRKKSNGTVGEWKRLAFTGEAQPASDVYAWAKAATKPSYSYSEITGGYVYNAIIDVHPESSTSLIAYYTNDLVNLMEKGGSITATNKTTGTVITSNTVNNWICYHWFNGTPSYGNFSVNAVTDVVEIVISLPSGSSYSWGTHFGIGFGNSTWRAKDVKIESGRYDGSTTIWKTVYQVTNSGNPIHDANGGGPDGQSGTPWNRIRITLTNFNTTNPRIAQIWTQNYGSNGLALNFLQTGGGTMYGSIAAQTIYPRVTNSYDLGTTSYQWNNAYIKTIYENGTALSSKYVTLADNQNITGTKTFINQIKFKTSANSTNEQLTISLIDTGSGVGYSKLLFDGCSYLEFRNMQLSLSILSLGTLMGNYQTVHGSSIECLWLGNSEGSGLNLISPYNIDGAISFRTNNSDSGITQYKLKVPSTVGYTSDRTIATTYDLEAYLADYMPYKTSGWRAVGGDGSCLYVRALRIINSGAYINRPICFDICGRGMRHSTVTVIFGNRDQADPPIDYFWTSDEERYYICKADTNVWDIYVIMSEHWGSVYIERVYGEGAGLFNVTTPLERVASLPSGGYYAAKLYLSSDGIVNNKLCVNPGYNSSNDNWNEGIRINRAADGWASVYLGGAQDSTYGYDSNGIWGIGRVGIAGTNYGIGDLVLSHSSGNTLTLYANGNAPKWNNNTMALVADIQSAFTPTLVSYGSTKSNVNGYNGIQFNIGTSNNGGLYTFTYGNCMALLLVSNLTVNTEYKVAACLVNSGGSYQCKVLTYRITSSGYLQIYQKENFIPTGYTAYLFKIKLY